VLRRGAWIDNPGGIGLQLSRIDVATDVLCNDITVTGEIRPAWPRSGATILSHASISVLRDDPQNWPADMRPGGLS
jgi:hypothetical protein